MKNRRKIAAVAAVIMIVLSLTGCGLFKPTPVSLMKKMADNLKKVSSVRSEVSADYEGSVSYSILSAPFTIKMDFDTETVTEPGVSHFDGTIEGTFFGFSLDLPVEGYAQTEDGEMTAYVSTADGTWVRHRPENTISAQEAGDTAPEIDWKMLLGLYQKIRNEEIKAELAEETETVCGQEAYRISFEITGELLQELLETAGITGDRIDALPEDFDLSGTGASGELYIYKKSQLPAQVTVDCAAIGDYVMQLMVEKNGLDVETEKFEITAVFTEYNTIDSIEIPEEVISTAVDGNGQGLLDGVIPGI